MSYYSDEGTATTANCHLPTMRWPAGAFNSAVVYNELSIPLVPTYDHSTGTCAGAHLELLS
jgi:hypothetical protein